MLSSALMRERGKGWHGGPRSGDGSILQTTQASPTARFSSLSAMPRVHDALDDLLYPNRRNTGALLQGERMVRGLQLNQWSCWPWPHTDGRFEELCVRVARNGSAQPAEEL